MSCYSNKIKFKKCPEGERERECKGGRGVRRPCKSLRKIREWKILRAADAVANVMGPSERSGGNSSADNSENIFEQQQLQLAGGGGNRVQSGRAGRKAAESKSVAKAPGSAAEAQAE